MNKKVDTEDKDEADIAEEEEEPIQVDEEADEKQSHGTSLKRKREN